MAITRINKPNDATWSKAWSVADATERATLLATAGFALGIARGDWVFQIDTSQWYVFAGGTTLLAIIDGSDVARLSAANVFTNTPQRISAADPEFNLFDTSVAANSRLMGWQNSAGLLLIFKANDDGSGGAALITIARSDGDLNLLGNIESFAGQIGFPSTQNPSSGANVLDDYEEGSWTPVIGGTGGTSGQTYGTQTGRYVKVGKQVAVMFEVALSNKGTITGNVQISGLPFVAESTPSRPVYPTQWSNLATNWVFIIGLVLESTSTMLIRGAAAAAVSSDTSLVTADINNNTFFRGAAVYMASA